MIEINEEGTFGQRVQNDPKFRQLLQKVHTLEDEIKAERAAHDQTREALAAAEERISRLLGEKITAGKQKKAIRKKKFQTRKGWKPGESEVTASARNEERDECRI